MSETRQGTWLMVGGAYHVVLYTDGAYAKETVCKQLGVDARSLARKKSSLSMQPPEDACETCLEGPPSE